MDKYKPETAEQIPALFVSRTPEEQAVIRKNIFYYCRLDTLAMIKTLEKLYDICYNTAKEILL